MNLDDIDPDRMHQPPSGKVHGTTPRGSRTPIASWGYAVHHLGEVDRLHVLSDHDFILVIDGGATAECDGVVRPLQPGDLILARPGMRVDLHWDRCAQSRNFFLHFTPRSLGLPPESAWPLIRQLPEGDVVRPLLAHAAWLLEHRPEGWAAAAEAALELSLRAFVTGIVETTLGKRGNLSPILERIVALLAQRWTIERMPPISLAELAAAAGVSREHLCREVQAELGCAPVMALRLVRLVRAASLLVRPDIGIAGVGARCGFADPYHFSRAFRAAWGASPSAYRAGIVQGRHRVLNGPPGIMTLCRRIWEEVPTR